MKIIRSGLLILLALGVVIGAMQNLTWATPLKNVNQLCLLGSATSGSRNSWKRILPDGTLQTFSLQPGQSFVMTMLSVRFYADTTNSGPYRLYLLAPNGTKLWIEPLDNLYYPTTGGTIYGGGKIDTFDPGIAMSVLPDLQVRQLPVPPNDPNSGPVVPGTFYGYLVGYLTP